MAKPKKNEERSKYLSSEIEEESNQNKRNPPEVDLDLSSQF